MDGREREAAATLRECRRVLTAHGSTILHEVTEGAGDIAAWQRYPAGEVYDPDNHVQYFYHCHSPPVGSAPGSEHGHFHLFLRAEGIPAGITPLVLPELAVANAPVPPQSAPLKRGERDEVVHLVAIAIDWRGEPVRLFTTNRWVTGETWYCADDVIRMLDRFQVSGDMPSAVLNRWIGAMVRLFQPEIAGALSQAASRTGRPAKIHFKVDTGMGRIGVAPSDAAAVLRQVSAYAGIVVEGCFTHFATADEADLGPTRKQLESFLAVLRGVVGRGLPIGLRHAANSAAFLALPETHLDIVRVGLAVYGIPPAPHLAGRVPLRRVMRLRARVAHTKRVPSGTPIGYGHTYRAPRETRIAVLLRPDGKELQVYG